MLKKLYDNLSQEITNKTVFSELKNFEFLVIKSLFKVFSACVQIKHLCVDILIFVIISLKKYILKIFFFETVRTLGHLLKLFIKFT